MGWRKHKREIKIARRNISNLRYAADTTLMAESEGRTIEITKMRKIIKLENFIK